MKIKSDNSECRVPFKNFNSLIFIMIILFLFLFVRKCLEDCLIRGREEHEHMKDIDLISKYCAPLVDSTTKHLKFYAIPLSIAIYKQ